MNPKTPNLEARAEALPKRIQRDNLGFDSLIELEVRSLLKEIETVGNLNLAGIGTREPNIAAGRSGGQQHRRGRTRAWREESNELTNARGERRSFAWDQKEPRRSGVMYEC